MGATACAITAIVLASLSGAKGAAPAVLSQRPPSPARTVSAVPDDASLEAEARGLLARLLSLSPVIPAPEPIFRDDPAPKAKAEEGNVILTRRLLRLCATIGARSPGRSKETRTALIAFVLAHELAHLVRRDAGSFGSREASEAVEMDADEQAVRRLFMAGIDIQPLNVQYLVNAIARETASPLPVTSAARRKASVEAALDKAKTSARNQHIGWLLTVAGRFDQAIAFQQSVASTYPYPQPLYVLALTRLQAAWRRSPCDEPTMLEWRPPLRYDPRSQVEAVRVRSADDACGPLRIALAKAATELAQAPDHPPAQIALASIRLMQNDPTLDPTRAIGGVKRIGDPCPTSPQPSLAEADACHVSLLSQYELSRRSPEARDAAIAGLRRLSEQWPAEPSLRFNLARLLVAAQRDAEAVPLWNAFLEGATPGPYRTEAQNSLSRIPNAVATSQSSSLAAPATKPSPLRADRLAVRSKKCRIRKDWPHLSLSSSANWSYCGDWSDELVIGNATETLIRSITVGSNTWTQNEPPAIPPLFTTTNPSGEELRIWATEAWTFREKAPQRVVYFKQPPK